LRQSQAKPRERQNRERVPVKVYWGEACGSEVGSDRGNVPEPKIGCVKKEYWQNVANGQNDESGKCPWLSFSVRYEKDKQSYDSECQSGKARFVNEVLEFK
jgi:hypothetical protein